MKKKASALSKDGLKDFFFRHGEKVGFGVIVVVVVAVLYLGYGIQSLDSDVDPEKLSKLAENKRVAISNSSWDEFVDYRTVNESPDTVDRSVGNNFVAGILKESPPPRKEPRKDPELKAPTDLYVYGQWVSIAAAGSGYNPIDNLAFFEEKENRRNRRDDSQDDEGPSSPFGGEGGRRPGTGGGDDDRQGGNPYGGAPLGQAAGPQDFETIPAVMKRELPGIAMLPNFRGDSSQVYGMYAIGVKAVVAYENQWSEYENLFSNSVGYSPARDYPEYVFLEVQRRVDGGEWMDISNDVRSKYVDKYAVVPPEIAKREYTDPTLTLPLPPVLTDRLVPFAMHPKVERTTIEEVEEEIEEAEQANRERGDFFDDPAEGSDESSDRDRGRGRDRGRDGNPYGGSGYPTGGDDNGNPYGGSGNPYGGSGNPYGGAGAGGSRATAGPKKDDVDVKLIRFVDLVNKDGRGLTYEYRVRVWLNDVNDPDNGKNASGNFPNSGRDGGRRPGMGPTGGAGGAGAGGAGAPGLGDGGGLLGGGGKEGGGGGVGGQAPSGPTGAPVTLTMLAPEVRSRLKAWKESAEYAKLPEGDPRRSARPSEWSEITPAMTVPEYPERYFAGPADAGSMSNAEGVEFPMDERFAKLAIQAWDEDLAVAVPDGRDVRRADVLDYTGEKVKVLNPLDLSLRVAGLPKDADEDAEAKYPIKTNTVVLDIMGGEELPSTSKTELKAPSEVLLFDMDGNFIFLDEFSSVQDYRHSLFLPDDQPTQKRKRRRQDEDDNRNRGRGRGNGNPYGGKGGYPTGGGGGNNNPYGNGGNPYGNGGNNNPYGNGGNPYGGR